MKIIGGFFLVMEDMVRKGSEMSAWKKNATMNRIASVRNLILESRRDLHGRAFSIGSLWRVIETAPYRFSLEGPPTSDMTRRSEGGRCGFCVMFEFATVLFLWKREFMIVHGGRRDQ
jgi:hypothetical protein